MNTRRAIYEVGAVAATALLHPVFVDVLHQRAVFIGVALARGAGVLVPSSGWTGSPAGSGAGVGLGGLRQSARSAAASWPVIPPWPAMPRGWSCASVVLDAHWRADGEAAPASGGPTPGAAPSSEAINPLQ